MRGINNLAALALGAFLVLSGQAFAEPASAAPKDGDRMQQEMGLTPDQAQKVRTIMSEQAAKRQALDEETRQRLSTVLNAEQMKRMAEHGPRHGGNWADHRADRMMDNLNLTADQKAPVEKTFSETRGKFEAMEKSNLAPDQKRAQMDALHAATREKLAGILNADQLKSFDEMHTRHMHHGDCPGGHEERHERRAPDAGQKQDLAPESKPKTN